MAKVPPPIGKGAPPTNGNTMGNLDTHGAENAPLNFKVAEDFRRDYKITAARLGMDMKEILQESFILFKREKAK